MTHNPSVIILAAGKGTRMKSDLPKVMHKVANREMINMVIDEAKKLEPKNITVVVSDGMENACKIIENSHPNIDIKFAIQNERKGTAHAVSTALSKIDDLGKKVIVLYGDTPLLREETLDRMLDKLDDYALCVLGFECLRENMYGRLVVDSLNHLERIIEYKDASHNERDITLCNSGVMAVSGVQITELVKQVKNENAAEEFYLTDIVGIAAEMHLKPTFIKTKEEEVLGVNSRSELAQIEAIKQERLHKRIMDAGATLLDPNSTYISFDTEVGNDVTIHPHVVFGKNVKIGNNVEIKSFTHIEDAKIKDGAVVGPFARIRPGTEIDENVRIGNFVEVKKSHLKKGAKVNHLSYIGDCEIGEDSNIGAGTITCNYDGYNKSHTKIGDNVFIGSNTALIAPVEIADGAMVGAGSVITKNVKKDDLAVSRSKQVVIEAGAKKFRDSKSKK